MCSPATQEEIPHRGSRERDQHDREHRPDRAVTRQRAQTELGRGVVGEAYTRGQQLPDEILVDGDPPPLAVEDPPHGVRALDDVGDHRFERRCAAKHQVRRERRREGRRSSNAERDPLEPALEQGVVDPLATVDAADLEWSVEALRVPKGAATSAARTARATAVTLMTVYTILHVTRFRKEIQDQWRRRPAA